MQSHLAQSGSRKRSSETRRTSPSSPPRPLWKINSTVSTNTPSSRDALKKFCGVDNNKSPKYHLPKDKDSDSTSREIFYFDANNEYCWSSQPAGTDMNLGQWSIGPKCNTTLTTQLILQFQRAKGSTGGGGGESSIDGSSSAATSTASSSAPGASQSAPPAVFKRAEDDAEDCGTPDAWELPKGQAECFEKLNPMIDGCDVDTQTDKWGGVVKIRTSKGCFDFGVFAVQFLGDGDVKELPQGKPDVYHMISM